MIGADKLRENKWFIFAMSSTVIIGGAMIYDLYKSFTKKQNAKFEKYKRIQEGEIPGTPISTISNHLFLRSKLPESESRNTLSDIPIYKICVTGGPSGGKTTALALLSEKLSERGFQVLMVPKISALTLENGGMLSLNNLTTDQVIKFEQQLIKSQMNLEDYFMELGTILQKPTIILCHRGVMDAAAYVSEDTWQLILDEQGWNTVNLRDRRYDAVLHLVSAADGAVEYFLKRNKFAVEEEINSAKSIDKKLQHAWIGHPNYSIIDNSEKGFDYKMSKTISKALKVVGLTETTRFTRKFLVEQIYLPFELKVEKFNVEETFLKSETGALSKVRKRGQRGTYTYIHSVRYRGQKVAEKVEVKKPIGARDYMILYEQRDVSKQPVFKDRKCFIWEKQAFILDELQNPKIAILRLQVERLDNEVKLPTFLRVVKEITNNPKFTTFELAQLGNKENLKISEGF